MRISRIFFSVLTLVGVLCLGACGGGATSAPIAGLVTGLGSGLSVVLQNNLGDTITVGSNVAFKFPTNINIAQAYSVTVLTQPIGESCTVTNPTGTIDSYADPVTNVVVNCVVNSSVGGTVAGLAAGNSVVLSDGVATLALATNGLFAFPDTQVANTTYTVSIVTQPATQTCTVGSPSGTVVSGVTQQVSVSCQ